MSYTPLSGPAPDAGVAVGVPWWLLVIGVLVWQGPKFIREWRASDRKERA